MDSVTQLKLISPFLDTHLLLHLLKNNAAQESAVLQTELKAQIAAQVGKESSDKVLDAAKDKANKLFTLLSNATLCDQLKKDKEFTLEKLRENHQVTIEDC
jgi:hypothetical protein